MRNLQRQNITSIRVELDNQICSPETNALPIPDSELNKLEDHIIHTLEDILKTRAEETKDKIFQALSEKQELSFTFEYSLEQIEDDQWLLSENRVQHGKKILTSVFVDIKILENIFSKLEISEDVLSDESETIASYHIIFNQDTLFKTKIEYCKTHDVGDIQWHDDDGEEYDEDHPYIYEQIADLVMHFDDFDPDFFSDCLNIDFCDTLYCDCCDTEYALGKLAETYFQNPDYNHIELTYIRER